jgi:DNA adenine methylase
MIINDLEKEIQEIEKEIKKDKKNIVIKEECQLIMNKHNLDSISFQKPFLKWVGGKTQIITEILNNFPKKINNYHEIFLGGGSVLLGVLSLIQKNKIQPPKNIYAYDLNKSLIYLYKNIQTNCDKLIQEIKKIVDENNNITGVVINRKPANLDEAKTSQESYYYWIRSKYNEMNDEDKITILGSAYFLFLNKTCFRGLYRIGPNGFNVPYGHYKNPSIYDEECLKNISELIKDVKFIHASFETSLLNVKKNDMVYCDPPYVPINATSFVNYNSDGFEGVLHEKLFTMLHELKKQKIKWMMSNSDTELVLDSFSDEKKYNIEKILCRRAINSKKPESKVNEVIIKSY